MTKFVYRFECVKTGTGPYIQGKGISVSHNFKTERHNDDAHPLPLQDNKLVQELIKHNKLYDFSSYVFGFATMKQARRWFSKSELQACKNTTFRICKYRVSYFHGAVIEGDRQLLFNKKFATKIKKFKRI